MKSAKYKFDCIVCKENLASHWKTQKLCSAKCRREFYKNQCEKYGKKLPTGTTGAIAEALVAIDLTEKGYQVFKAFSPTCYCDLIATNLATKTKLEIEVRTGSRTITGRLQFPKPLSKYNKGNVNIYAVVERNTREIIYLNNNIELINLTI